MFKYDSAIDSCEFFVKSHKLRVALRMHGVLRNRTDRSSNLEHDF